MSDWQDPTGSRHPESPRPRDPVASPSQGPPAPPPGATAYFYPAPPERRTPIRPLAMIGGSLFIFALGVYIGMFLFLKGAATPSASYREGTGPETIAIIPVDGMITGETAEFVRGAVTDAAKNQAIKAIVLRVDSPGGTVPASDQIHHMLQTLKAERNIPVVASYGGYAASGGYYVSCASDYIYAEPTTITGSIGVIAPYFTIHEMLGKIGVTPEVITSSAAVDKDTGSMFRPWTDQDRTKLRDILDSVQDRFVTVVAEGRSQHLTPEQVREVATGAGITAHKALERKLVDEIGYIDDAIEKARTLAGIAAPKPPVIIYRTPQSLADVFLSTGASSGQAAGGAGPGFDVHLNPDMIRRTLTELSIPKPSFVLQP